MFELFNDTVQNKPKHTVELYTDGACLRNPGPGGWAFILRHPASGRNKEESGSEPDTTNNRMETLAVIRGIEALKLPSMVELHSDSQYVVQGINERMATQESFGWRRSAKSKKIIKNADLWQRLWELSRINPITAHWVEGHAGHPENERCDKMAEAAAARINTVLPKGPKSLEEMADDLLAESEDPDE